MIRVVVDRAPVDPGVELSLLPAAGATATFIGAVRGDDGVTTLELEHYPGMTEVTLRHLAQEAVDRWTLDAVSIVHRVGPMTPGETIVFVAATAPHRSAALEACAYLIDRLKTDAPFWKREVRGAAASWVESRDSDHAAAARWVFE